MVTAKNLTTHVALVLDRSISMEALASKTIQAADELVEFLAKKSKEAGQEWRVSVYTFGNEVDCHIWDMDVLRLPSMKEHYKISGNTALIDATNLALDDGEKITEHRGDHAFLVYIITDGEENWSTGGTSFRSNSLWSRPSYTDKAALVEKLKKRLGSLPDNRTVAVLAPNSQGAEYSRRLGFENIFLWDASTEAGMEKAAQAIQTSATTYMEARTQGAAGLRSMQKGGLFVGGNVNAKTVKAANLKPLATSARRIVRVTQTDDTFEKVVKPVTKTRLKPETGKFVEIDKFVKQVNQGQYPLGDVFYQLVKTEKVQGDKEIAVVENNTNKVYVGDGARQLLGLPEELRTVKPDHNSDYTIFIQSNSLNRHLPVGCQIMILKR